MRALALIYSQRVPGFKKIPIGFNPKQKRNPNPKRKAKTRLSVDRAVDRPMSTVGRAVDRTQTESNLLSVSRPCGRPLLATVDRAVDRAIPVHVVHTGRPGGRPAFSTSSISSLPTISTSRDGPHKWLKKKKRGKNVYRALAGLNLELPMSQGRVIKPLCWIGIRLNGQIEFFYTLFSF